MCLCYAHYAHRWDQARPVDDEICNQPSLEIQKLATCIYDWPLPDYCSNDLWVCQPCHPLHKLVDSRYHHELLGDYRNHRIWWRLLLHGTRRKACRPDFRQRNDIHSCRSSWKDDLDFWDSKDLSHHVEFCPHALAREQDSPELVCLRCPNRSYRYKSTTEPHRPHYAQRTWLHLPLKKDMGLVDWEIHLQGDQNRFC